MRRMLQARECPALRRRVCSAELWLGSVLIPAVVNVALIRWLAKPLCYSEWLSAIPWGDFAGQRPTFEDWSPV